MTPQNGSIAIDTLAQRPKGVNIFRRQGTPPRAKTLRRFALQRQFGMSGFRKETICPITARILHPTKGTVYGRVEPDGRLNYFR